MKVRNVNGAAGVKCADVSWLSFWEHTTGQKAFMCYGKDCIERPSQGALVQRDDPANGLWFVVPLCDDCGSHTHRDREIWDLARLVSVLDAKVPPRGSPRRALPRRSTGMLAT